MKKIIALFEVDDSFDCKEYHASLSSEHGVTHDYAELKELPQKKAKPIAGLYTLQDARDEGWNACLDKIEKGKLE